MTARPVWGWTVGLLVAVFLGGGAVAGVARAQSPASSRYMAQFQRYGAMPVGYANQTRNAGFYAPATRQGWGMVQPVSMHHSQSRSGSMSWQGGYPAQTACGCGRCGQGGWAPTHHHTFEYKQPTNLVYPPANQPASVVQYPYYTLKGPSDFFMK